MVEMRQRIDRANTEKEIEETIQVRFPGVFGVVNMY